jgi:porin
MKKWLLLSFFGMGASLHASENAYVWENALTLEAIHNLSGGIEKGSAELANLDITLAIDSEAAGWWQNGNLFVYVLGDYGRDPAEFTGGVQGTSNIAADDAIKIYEFWYQHSFIDDSVKLLTGLHDYNSTFYSLESAGLFNHPSFGIGPDTSQATPSIFPTTAWTLHLTLNFDAFYLLTAVYDGVPGNPENPRGTHIKFDSGDGLFKAIEMGVSEESRYKIALGYWSLSAEVENPVDASLIDSNSGIYLIGEKYLLQNLAVFFQFGQADEDTNQIGRYYGGGIVYSNAIKEGDALGLAVAKVENGDGFMVLNPLLLESETALELSYSYPWSDAISSQLSVYQIQNPDMDPTLDDALALGARLVLSF